MGLSDLFCDDGESKANGWFDAFVITVLIIGSYVLLRFLVRNLVACCRLCCRGRQDNLLSKYGRQDGSTFAVVTGGSEGLGLALCDQLAEHGFNICMVSRNQEKIDGKVAELQAKHPDKIFKGVQADLSTLTTVA